MPCPIEGLDIVLHRSNIVLEPVYTRHTPDLVATVFLTSVCLKVSVGKIWIIRFHREQNSLLLSIN
jgi:hypothetical protein